MSAVVWSECGSLPGHAAAGPEMKLPVDQGNQLLESRFVPPTPRLEQLRDVLWRRRARHLNLLS
jgi:hypothetical protein